MLQLVDVRFGKQIGPSRKHLPQLDVGGTELDQALPKRLCRGADDTVNLILRRHRATFEGEQPLAVGEIAQAIVGKEPNRRDKARKMLWRENHALRGGQKA